MNQQLINDIATELGPEWSVSNQNDNYSRLVHNSGLMLSIGAYWNKPPKCSVCHISDVDKLNDRYDYPTHSVEHLTDSINFSWEKGAKKIAKDIKTRLLDDAFEFYAIAKKQKENHDKLVDAILNNYTLLKNLSNEQLQVTSASKDYRVLDVSVNNDHKCGFGDIQIGTDTVTLKLHSLPFSATIAILKAYREWAKTQ